MDKKNFTAAFLLIVWIALAAAPLASAFQRQHCPVCDHKSCPMKKPAESSCHHGGDAASCLLKAAAGCKHQNDPAAFTFQGILPDLHKQTHQLVFPFPDDSASIRIAVRLQMDTPPPRTQHS